MGTDWSPFPTKKIKREFKQQEVANSHKLEKLFFTTQTPVNISWQGFSFANYKLNPLDFQQKKLHYTTSNFFFSESVKFSELNC
jgi:hypothetical protein